MESVNEILKKSLDDFFGDDETQIVQLENEDRQILADALEQVLKSRGVINED